MADIFKVAEIISKMADGFEEDVMKCLDENSEAAVEVVREQLWAGLSGDDSKLSPNYDDDPFFETDKYWYHRNDDYKQWKYKETPPSSGWRLNLPPRAMNEPNLFIDGTFYSYIEARRAGETFVISANGGDSAEIVSKWGDNILRIGSTATEYFCRSLIGPHIWDFFESCGW